MNTRLPADGVNAFPGIIMGAQHHEGVVFEFFQRDTREPWVPMEVFFHIGKSQLIACRSLIAGKRGGNRQ